MIVPLDTPTLSALALYCLLAFFPLLSLASTSSVTSLDSSTISPATSQYLSSSINVPSASESTTLDQKVDSEKGRTRFRITSSKGGRGVKIEVDFPSVKKSFDASERSSDTGPSSAGQALPQIETVLPIKLNLAATPDMPGQSLAVLPIGLGIVGGLMAIGLVVFAYMTVQRYRYRKLFRERRSQQEDQLKGADQVKAGGSL